MKKRYRIVALIALAISVGLVINDYTKISTFKEVVSDRLNGELTSIAIITSLTDDLLEDEIYIKDSSQIELIMNALSRAKLRKVRSFPINNYPQNYTLLLNINNKVSFMVELYGKDYVYISSADPKYASVYKITNEFDPIVIQGLFK